MKSNNYLSSVEIRNKSKNNSISFSRGKADLLDFDIDFDLVYKKANNSKIVAFLKKIKF